MALQPGLRCRSTPSGLCRFACHGELGVQQVRDLPWWSPAAAWALTSSMTSVPSEVSAVDMDDSFVPQGFAHVLRVGQWVARGSSRL